MNAMQHKFQLRDPVWWTEPDDPNGPIDLRDKEDYAGWVIGGRRRNGTYHVIWVNWTGGGGAHERDLRPRDDAGPVPAYVDDAIAEEAMLRAAERRHRR